MSVVVVGYDAFEQIAVPEKKVLNFLKYIEKETNIRFDISSLKSVSAWVTTYDDEHKTNICMPAEFYALYIKCIPLGLKIRFCPCENCNKIAYAQLFTIGTTYEISVVYEIWKKLQNTAPDIFKHDTNIPNLKSIEDILPS